MFDGECNLCNASVRFLLKRDPKEQFIFSSLQSDAAKEILLHCDKNLILPDSLVVFSKGQLYFESEAVFKICAQMDYPWKALQVIRFLPKAWTDAGYRFVAKRRKKWFGSPDHCVFTVNTYENRFI